MPPAIGVHDLAEDRPLPVTHNFAAGAAVALRSHVDMAAGMELVVGGAGIVLGLGMVPEGSLSSLGAGTEGIEGRASKGLLLFGSSFWRECQKTTEVDVFIKSSIDINIYFLDDSCCLELNGLSLSDARLGLYHEAIGFGFRVKVTKMNSSKD